MLSCSELKELKRLNFTLEKCTNVGGVALLIILNIAQSSIMNT